MQLPYVYVLYVRKMLKIDQVIFISSAEKERIQVV